MKMWFNIILITTVMVSYSLKMASTTGNDGRVCKSEPVDDSELRINHILCGYMFSAQIYMRLIEGLLANEERLKEIPREKDLSFTEQAAKMNATLHNVTMLQNTNVGNIMWIFSVYAERVLAYMKSVINDSPTESHYNILTVHNSVKLLLEHYMESERCAYYMKNKHVIEMRKRVEWEATSNYDNLQGLLTKLEARNSDVLQRLNTSSDHSSISTAEYGQFSLNVLGLYGLMADVAKTEKILKSSGVELNKWDEVLWKLKREHILGTQAIGGTLNAQISSLTTLNDKFICTVKVIIIRLLLTSIKDGHLKQHVREMVSDIVELENHLGLQDDEDLKHVKSLVENATVFSHMNTTAVNEINNVLTKFSAPLYNAETRDLTVVDKPCRRLRGNTKKFVKSLKIALAGINFSIIKKFTQLISSKEYEKLAELEILENIIIDV